MDVSCKFGLVGSIVNRLLAGFQSQVPSMSSLPPEQTPLDRHSLVSLESWLQRLGAERSCEDPCRWIWLMPEWSAEIVLEQEELRVAWEQGGQRSQCCFPYGLPRSDVEAALSEGP